MPAPPCLPELRRKRHHRQQEEDAHNFEQNLATHSFEWLEESGYAASHVSRRLPGCAPSPLCILHGILLYVRARALRVIAHDGLSSHPACNTQPDPEHPSYGLRSHFDMMVAAADISPPPCIQRKMPVAGVPLAK